jgi:hypothetical protein
MTGGMNDNDRRAPLFTKIILAVVAIGIVLVLAWGAQGIWGGSANLHPEPPKPDLTAPAR